MKTYRVDLFKLSGKFNIDLWVEMPQDLQPWDARAYLLEKYPDLHGHAVVREGPWCYPHLILNLGEQSPPG